MLFLDTARNEMIGVSFIYLSCAVITVTSQQEGERASYRTEDEGANSLSETIPGEADSDYPAYTQIPKTAFSCEGRTNWGYYADTETDCQVFHVCDSQFSKLSFICPIGSVFNQKLLICDWWYKTVCGEGRETVAGPEDDFNNQEVAAFEGTRRRDQTGFDLNIAGGGNPVPSSNANTLDQKILSRAAVSGSRKQFPPGKDQFGAERYIR